MPTIVFVGGLIDGETLDLPDLPDTYRVAVPMSRPQMLGSTEPARPLFAEAVYRRVIGKKGGVIWLEWQYELAGVPRFPRRVEEKPPPAYRQRHLYAWVSGLPELWAGWNFQPTSLGKRRSGWHATGFSR